ncbi:MAG TPA: hypothetical protein VHS53_04910 [Mucilaginibacter sp.]|jgi:hypothetical protein|nr:hypothetical protein [Mucilaginibacter sp.]
MKKYKLILASLIALVFIAGKTRAQTAPAAPAAPAAQTATAAPAASAGSLAGKWDILFKGLPSGDTHIIFNVLEQEGKWSGSYQDMETKKDVPLTKVEKDDKGIVLYFTAQGYDVSVNVERKDDDDHVKANMMGMFEGTGERVKQ